MNAATIKALADLEKASRRLREGAQADIKPSALEEYLSAVIEAIEQLLHGPCALSARAHYLILSMRTFDMMEAEERQQAGQWEPPSSLSADDAGNLLDQAVRIRMLKRVGVLDEDEQAEGDEEDEDNKVEGVKPAPASG